jgi:hypothetical protein
LLQAEYRKEGMNYYMKIPCGKEYTEGYDSALLQYHVVPYLLPIEVREMDGACELYYRLQYRTTLKSVLGHLALTGRRMGNIMQSIVGALESVEEYMIEPEMIMWKTEYIFIEADTGKLQFCYYPDESQRQGSIKEVLTEILQVVDKRDEETTLLLLHFFNLITEPECSLEQLKSFLREKIGENDRPEEGYFNASNHKTDWQIAKREDNHEKQREKKAENRKISKKEDDSNQESTVEKLVKTLLLLTAAVNFILIALLLVEILTYDYIGYLLVAMAVLIVLTIVYMSISNEESPDDIMKEYFEENGSMQGEVNGQPQIHVVHEEYSTSQQEFYGETTVLSPDSHDDTEREIVVEEYPRPLVLASFEKGKYPAIQIEKSTVVGCMEEGCNYLLKERGISRMHAKLMKKEDGLYLLDLNSTNGTFLNGESLISGEDVKIEEGDIVAFAKCEYMVVQG